MQNDPIEPVRVMRTAAWIWIGYLAALTVMDAFIYAKVPMGSVTWYHIINLLPALVFLGLSYSRWLATNADLVAALMILLISTVPILLNYLIDLHLPPAPLSNIEGMALRQMPILFIGLVLVAWHYRLLSMILYSVGINIFELLTASIKNSLGFEQQTAFYFVTLIRTISFVVVGIFINLLINRLRTQQASLKTANNQLSHYASTLESLTVSRERNRMSRELHDTVVHSLSGLSVQLETIKAYWEVKPETAKMLLDQSLETTRSGLQETRRALKALRASPLEDLGLVIAIRKLAETAVERGNFLLELSLPENALILSPDVEQGLYRITQEAVENVLQHANARKLGIHLAVNAKDIRLTIQDDGAGFDPLAASQPGHFGLSGMKERASLIGGELAVISKPGAGTTIQLVIKGYQQ